MHNLRTKFYNLCQVKDFIYFLAIKHEIERILKSSSYEDKDTKNYKKKAA